MNQQNRYWNEQESNLYPSFLDQVQMDMDRNPEKYRIGYDAYQHHATSHLGLHITDPSRSVVFMPEHTNHSYQDQYLKRMADREKGIREAARLKREEELKNEFILFKLCRRTVTTLKQIWNG